MSSKIPVSKSDFVEFDKFKFLRMQRDYKCTCFCLERPVMKVYSIEMGKEKYIGKIVNPFSCCEIILQLYNENNNLDFIVKGDICQMGVMCRGCPCDACQNAQFSICDKSGNVLKPLLKKSAGCLKAAFSDVDEFSIIFPDGINVYQKGMLMAAGILLDYLYYEESPANQHNNGGGNFKFKF